MSNIQAINTEAVVGGFTQTELDTLKSTIAKDTTNEQFALFVQTCVRSGLNPFLNQIYCIVYKGQNGPQMSIQIAVEGIVALAKKHPQYKGFIASEVKENDEFEIDIVTGEPKHRITSMQRGKTVGAYCVAYREGAPNIAVTITMDQVDHFLRSSIQNQKKMWTEYFDDMIVKHAIKRAFKRQFGIEVAEDEYGVQSSPEPVPYVRKDITPATELIDQPKEQPNKDEEEDEATKLKKARAEMKKKFAILGITDKAEMGEYITKNANPKGDKPTLSELLGLLKIMDMHIEMKENQSDDDLLE